MDEIEIIQYYADGECGHCGKKMLLFCTTVNINEKDYVGGICMNCQKKLLMDIEKPQFTEPPEPRRLDDTDRMFT